MGLDLSLRESSTAFLKAGDSVTMVEVVQTEEMGVVVVVWRERGCLACLGGGDGVRARLFLRWMFKEVCEGYVCCCRE